MVLQIWDPITVIGRWAVPKFLPLRKQRPWAAHGPLSLQNPEASCDSMPPPPQRLAQKLVCVIQAFPAIGHGLSGSKTQRSQNTGVLERSFLDRQTFWNKAFGVEELAENQAFGVEELAEDHDSPSQLRFTCANREVAQTAMPRPGSAMAPSAQCPVGGFARPGSAMAPSAQCLDSPGPDRRWIPVPAIWRAMAGRYRFRDVNLLIFCLLSSIFLACPTGTAIFFVLVMLV